MISQSSIRAVRKDINLPILLAPRSIFVFHFCSVWKLAETVKMQTTARNLTWTHRSSRQTSHYTLPLRDPRQKSASSCSDTRLSRIVFEAPPAHIDPCSTHEQDKKLAERKGGQRCEPQQFPTQILYRVRYLQAILWLVMMFDESTRDKEHGESA